MSFVSIIIDVRTQFTVVPAVSAGFAVTDMVLVPSAALAIETANINGSASAK
jgi:hypothetical protein